MNICNIHTNPVRCPLYTCDLATAGRCDARWRGLGHRLGHRLGQRKEEAEQPAEHLHGERVAQELVALLARDGVGEREGGGEAVEVRDLAR